MPAMTRARLHLTFPERLISEPVVHRLGADFGLVTNIRRANLEEDHGGWLILEVEGDEDRIAAAVAWLAELGLQVDRIES
jgi:ABC-type methionine transport system ATPase subunit